ncbi:hypothetical protein MalM25_11880 [Planctomycetes bacterium MalM25]|nr:hypothetical protein MalM25_11880 [Planctomycetes bacterium MalM25]
MTIEMALQQTTGWLATAPGAWLLAQAEGSPMLDAPTRAVLLMALLAFVILGLGLIAGAMIGGRWVRRLGGEDLTKPMPLRRRGEPQPAGTRTTLSAPVVGPNWNRQGDTASVDTPGAETQVG